ncbi:MAG TPA: hypothetical protein PKM69_03485 [Bacteroidales bacterium]|nr:hypothetical protein [Bacteroidales bacterium]
MRRTIIGIIILVVTSTIVVSGQTKKNDASQTLEKLFGRLLTDYEDVDRLKINDSIRLIIDSYTESDTVFEHHFTNLRYLGQIVSPDSHLKIITWNLIFKDGSNKYFSYLIKKVGKGEKNRVYRLTGTHNNEPIRTDTTYSETDWYGALYYDIKPFKTGKQTNYALLGIDYGNSSTNRKIIEVLSFSPDGEIIFGKRCFVSGNELKFREVLEYSSGGVMTLRFNSSKEVVFDHLVSFSKSNKSDREYYGAEYSYDAYILKKGVWQFTRNFIARNKK